MALLLTTAPLWKFAYPMVVAIFFANRLEAPRAQYLFAGTGVSTRGPVKVIADPTEFTNRIRQGAFPPVMSYFDPAKLTTSGINFIEEQRARYDTIVKSAKVVVIVGIRLRPNDKHLWDALAATNAEVVYCSGKNAGHEFAEWVKDNRKGKAGEVLYGYFDENFEKICSRIEL